MEVKKPEHTFSDFFRSTIKPKIPGRSGVEYELLSSHVGPQKSKLDPVDPDLLVLPVIASFGRFLKYCVKDEESSEPVGIPRNASDVLMRSARSSRTQGSGSGNFARFKEISERNNCDKLYNDVVRFFVLRGLTLEESEIDTVGLKLVRLFRDIFWYIDGFHYAFKQRSLAIP